LGKTEQALFDELTVTTNRDFSEAVEVVQIKAQEKGFKVLHVHDVKATLAESGYEIDSVKIIEICNAEFGSAILAADLRVSLLMPCKVSVYRKNGKTFISALRPHILGQLFPGLAALVTREEELMRAIVEESK
jgi:uncharacterized protein (DUF302 family)